MKRILLLGTALAALAALAFLGVPAFAADMPLKAPKSSPLLYPYDSNGFYWGVDVQAGVAQSQVNGGLALTSLVQGNLTAAGAGAGGVVGYVANFNKRWVAVEVSVDYTNISATAPVPGESVSIASRVSAAQMVKLGGFEDLLASLTSGGILGFSFPSFTPPSAVPGFNIVGNTAHPYVSFGMAEFNVKGGLNGFSDKTWAVVPAVGAGVMYQLADSTGKLNGSVLDLGARVEFADQGVTMNFDNSSPHFGASAKMGKRYLGVIQVKL